MKFRVPEIALGALLAVAVFAVGMLFSSRHPQQVVGVNAKQGATESVQSHGDSQHASSGEVKPVSQPQQSDRHSDAHEIYGVKPGEFLLFLATVGLWYATSRLVRDARKTSERQLRAYVLKDTGDIGLQSDTTQSHQVILANVSFKNFGQTPGYDLNAWTHCKIADADKPPFDDIVGNNQRAVIGPGGEYQTISDPIWVSAADLAAIRLQTKVIFVWGKATYRDAFGQNWVFTFRGRNTESMHKRDDSDWVGWGVAAHPGFGDEETKG